MSTRHLLLTLLLSLSVFGCCGTTLEIIDREVPVIIPPLRDTVRVDDVPEEILVYLEALQMQLAEADGMTDSLLTLLKKRPSMIPETFRGSKITDRNDSVDVLFHYPRYFDIGVRYAPLKVEYRDTTQTVRVDEYSFFAKVGYAVLFAMAGFVLGLVMLAIVRK